jgi:hypothetical protein
MKLFASAEHAARMYKSLHRHEERSNEMTNAIKIAAVAVATLTLAACGTPDSGYSDKSSGSRQATSAAESACMAAVNRQYGGNYDVRVISSEYSEANSLVMVAGGPNRERWRCLVSNDGKVQDLSLAQGKPAAGGGQGMQANPLSSEVRALQGMRAANLDSEMNRLGFRNVGGYQSGGAAYSTWWNPRGEQCAKVETREGRVADIEAIYAGNCR